VGQKTRPFYIFKLQKIIKRFFCTHQGQSIMNLPTICEFTSFTIWSGATWWISCHLIIYLIAVGVISLHPYRKRPPSWKWPPFWIFNWLTCFFKRVIFKDYLCQFWCLLPEVNDFAWNMLLSAAQCWQVELTRFI